jgi:pSer/pThr/pTyr-binding forkhead associated (FHA) protein
VEKPTAARRLRPSSDPESFAVICVETQRVVRLPREGSIVLGRFEPDYAGPPDVDLTFDDGIVPSVSRRHARITARDGAHWIEDLGSTNGTYRNGFQLAIGERAQLQPGDRILLGRCRLVYDPAPLWVLEPGVSASDVSVLTITHTGQSLGIPDGDEITIGRSDRDAVYTPDVDLSVADDIARHVLRQHARLVQKDGRHCVESADNAANIKVNGHPIRMGDSPILLSPGDQLWLGGCVLAYEWRSFDEEMVGFEHAFSRSLQNNGGAKRSTSTSQPT